MTRFTIPSVEAQNNFGTLMDRAQRQVISVTRRGRPTVLVMSPELFQDHLDGQSALQAEAEGSLGISASAVFLDQFRHA